MAITDDLRKTLSDPTPLYFAAGTADLALQQAKKVPGLVEQLRAEAPARIEAVRNTDPKAVQENQAVQAAQAKEAQESLAGQGPTEVLGSALDADLKKLGETAQDLALRGVGVAAEYAVKARETYEKVAEHGEQAVKTWRGEAAEEIDGARPIAVEPEAGRRAGRRAATSRSRPSRSPPAGAPGRGRAAPAKKPAAEEGRRPPARPTAKKTTPPAK